MCSDVSIEETPALNRREIPTVPPLTSSSDKVLLF